MKKLTDTEKVLVLKKLIEKLCEELETPGIGYEQGKRIRKLARQIQAKLLTSKL